MKLYVFERVYGLTSAYHSGGGAVVITDGDPVEALRNAASSEDEFELSEGEPVQSYDVESFEEKVIIFPDSGCC